jgi:hypothetical protein
MSAARVQFLTLAGDPCGPDEKPARFRFVCVGFNRTKPRKLYDSCPTMCGDLLIAPGPHSAAHGVKRDPQGNNGGRPQWTWDGNRQAPTFAPSINCEGHCGWHGYIERGRCVTTQKQDEPEPQ